MVLLGRAAAAVLPALLLLAGCTRSDPSDDDLRVSWQIDPQPPSVGPATVGLTMTDAQDDPVTGARLRLEGHMTHPGMAPVIADVMERAPGEYEADLSFSMSGDWLLLLTGELADGRRIRREFGVPGVRQAP